MSKKKNWKSYVREDNSELLRTSIRFKNQGLSEVRNFLLKDLSREYFGILLAKQEVIGQLRVLTVLDSAFPPNDSYKNQASASLCVDFETFMKGVLEEVDQRLDVDTIIDVHTHPFSGNMAWFSSVDDKDEANFALYLNQHNINYASIVFTKNNYKARYWEVDCKGHPWYTTACIKTQKKSEQIYCHDEQNEIHNTNEDVNDRSIRALGLKTMREISNTEAITIVGLGGLGSIVAEHLIHMGFNKLNLIDFDKLEISNLNRIVGATYKQAKNGELKVEAIKNHLLNINPYTQVNIYPNDVFDSEIEEVIANSDWVIMATDNHASRFYCQELCFKYFVPFIAAGVNITVDDDKIVDISGESILIRMGDNVCLRCLGRVNFNEIAKEKHPDPVVREGLVRKGYVQGADIHEPAVKTLNTYLATIVVDTLVNQYTERRRDSIITVYEDNEFQTIYEDKESLDSRNKQCSICCF